MIEIKVSEYNKHVKDCHTKYIYVIFTRISLSIYKSIVKLLSSASYMYNKYLFLIYIYKYTV